MDGVAPVGRGRANNTDLSLLNLQDLLLVAIDIGLPPLHRSLLRGGTAANNLEFIAP
jgi:hypothetical protein